MVLETFLLLRFPGQLGLSVTLLMSQPCSTPLSCRGAEGMWKGSALRSFAALTNPSGSAGAAKAVPFLWKAEFAAEHSRAVLVV